MRLVTVLFIALFAVAAARAGAAEGGPAAVDMYPTALPGDAVFEDGLALPDGTWWEKAFFPESGIALESIRDFPLPYDMAAIKRHIEKMWSDAGEIEVAAFPELAEKLSYPVFGVSFTDGCNEDTRLHAGAFVFTDAWTFWFDLSASADDCFKDDVPDGTESPGLKSVMKSLLLSVDFTPEGMEIIPDIGPPAYFADASPGAGGKVDLSILDALLRIKRMAYPEAETDGEAMVAYRYDGVGEVGGRPALLFSFGADSPEKFTAERHFAVDGRGIVFEMDIVAGGEYEPVVDWAPKYWEGEEPPNWWGEYRDGDKTLRITSFRSGPEYFYFHFCFEAGGEPVGEDIAVVDYENVGAFGNLAFRLEPGGNAVRVELNPASADDGGEWTGGMTGTYTRVE